MQPLIPPEFIRHHHKLMVQEELQRNYPEHHLYFRDAEPIHGFVNRGRDFIASLLIAAGRRIAPAPRHDNSPPSAGEMPVAGSAGD